MKQYESVFLADLLKESIQQGTPSLTEVSNNMSPLLRRVNYIRASTLAYYADSFLFTDGQGR